ncbi:MAG: hypothetical protein NTX50_06090 [Candidatus Sumerlaeota bacterium]|nr:hypothetical protein [Candidatus Sumerlaeota bacterium]
MPTIIRIVFAAAFLITAAVCTYGFLASFEPYDPAISIPFRLTYGSAGLACLISAAWIFFAGRRKQKPGT